MHQINLSFKNLHTDLIMETIQGYGDVKGIETVHKTYDHVQVEELQIDQEGSKKIGKKEGRYKTILFEDITDTSIRKEVISVFRETLQNLLEEMNISSTASCLVLGLGNRLSTPDALGPKAVEQILVTRHLFLLDPGSIEEGYRNVSSFIPGVTGTTGIETKDVIMGIVKETKPDFLIVLDALASSSIDRMNKTIQMTDTGIHPGSGVGNSRVEISKETIGIPVIAIGIPTVVDAVTIVSDTMKYLLKQLSYTKENENVPKNKLVPFLKQNYLSHEENLSEEEKMKIMGLLGTLSEEEVKTLVFDVLTPIGYNLMVTVKEVDFLIDKLALLLASGINQVLHPKYENS